jgi:cytoskeletal protein CcmA (bactofilin family)
MHPGGRAMIKERSTMFFKRKTPKETAGGAVAAVSKATTPTLITGSYTLKGRIHGQGSVEVQGRLEGQVDVRGRVAVSPTASVQGEIKAEVLEIGGKVTGRLDVSRHLRLGATARFEGSAAAAGIEMAAGACLNGEVHMKS